MKTIYTNGTIITMDENQGNALVEENGRIISVGEYDDLYQEDMLVIDLKGHTLMPSFIDAHSHLSGYAMGLLQVALDDCQTIEDIQKCILEYIKANKIKANQFINCKGYNQENLKEKRHITKQHLILVLLYNKTRIRCCFINNTYLYTTLYRTLWSYEYTSITSIKY